MNWEPTAELSDFSSGIDPLPGNVKNIFNSPTLRFEYDEKTGQNTITPFGLWAYVRLSTATIDNLSQYSKTRRELQDQEKEVIYQAYRNGVIQPKFKEETILDTNLRFAIGIWTTLTSDYNQTQLRTILINEPELLCWYTNKITDYGKLDALIYRISSYTENKVYDLNYIIVPSYKPSNLFGVNEEPFWTYWFLNKDKFKINSNLKKILTELNGVMHSNGKYNNPHIITHKTKDELESHLLRTCFENLIQMHDVWTKYYTISRLCETVMTGTITDKLAKCRAVSMMPISINRLRLSLMDKNDRINLLLQLYETFNSNSKYNKILKTLYLDTTKLSIPSSMLRIRYDESMYPISETTIKFIIYEAEPQNFYAQDLIENNINAIVTSTQIPNGEIMNDFMLESRSIKYDPIPYGLIIKNTQVIQDYILKGLFTWYILHATEIELTQEQEELDLNDYVNNYSKLISEGHYALSQSCRFLNSITPKLNEFKRIRREGNNEVFLGSHEHIIQSICFNQSISFSDSGRLRPPDDNIRDRSINNSTFKLTNLLVNLVMRYFLKPDSVSWTDYDDEKLRTITYWGAENEPMVNITKNLFPTCKVIGKGERAIGFGNQRTILGAELETDGHRNLIISDINQNRDTLTSQEMSDFVVQIVEKLVRQSDVCAIKINFPHHYILNLLIKTVNNMASRNGARQCFFVRMTGQNHYTSEIFAIISRATDGYQPLYCRKNHPACAMCIDNLLTIEEKVNDMKYLYRLSSKIPDKDNPDSDDLRDLLRIGGLTFGIVVTREKVEEAINHLSHYISHLSTATIQDTYLTILVGSVTPSRVSLTSRVKGYRKLKKITMPSHYSYGKISINNKLNLSPFRETTLGSLIADACRNSIYITALLLLENRVDRIIDIGSANHKLISLVPINTEYITYDPINIPGSLDEWNIIVKDELVDFENLDISFELIDNSMIFVTFALFAPDPVTNVTPNASEQLNRLNVFVKTLLDRYQELNWVIGFTFYSDDIFKYIEKGAKINGINLRFQDDVTNVPAGITFSGFDLVEPVNESELVNNLGNIDGIELTYGHPTMLDYTTVSIFSRCVANGITSIRAPIVAEAVWIGTLSHIV
ncbi:MAG: P4 [Corparats virus 1]|nr:MAG: P4 [Corparats virus 1]